MLSPPRSTLQELQQSQALLKIASRVGHVGGWTVEVASGKVSWSDEVCAIHGLPPGSSPTLDEGLGRYAPEYQQTMRQAVQACVAEGTPFDIESQIIHASGRRVWVRAIGEAERDETGTVWLIQGAFQDISERKAAQEESRLLTERLLNTVESITDAFFTLDRAWTFTYVNGEAERVLQRPRADLLGRCIWDEFPQALGSPFEAGYKRAMNDRVAAQFEAFYPPLQCWVDVRAYPSDQGLAVYFQDVTARHEAQAEILRLNAELEERVRLRTAQLEAANSELEAFSYSVAHDLRSPLSTIDGFSRLLEKALPPDAGDRPRHYLGRILSGVKQMNDMTEALLALAKVSRAPLEPQTVDLGALARNLLQMWHEQEPARELKLRVQEPLPAWGDPRLLKLVMENLLGNAWKFSSKKPVTEITVGSERGPEGETVYFVRDNGAGFDMDRARELFGTFVRLHEQEEFKGTGMGLANVQRIVAHHGGRIWADAVPGKGATFYFTLDDAPSPA